MSDKETANNYREYWNDLKGKDIGNPAGYYLRNAPIWDKAPVSNDIKYILSFLKGHPDISTILDAACGTGRLFPHIKKWNCTGVEWSDSLHPAVANNKYGIKVHKKDLRHEKLDTTFDLVLNTQVMLHVPPQYAKGTIRNLLDMTEKYLMIITWDAGCGAPSADTAALKAGKSPVGDCHAGGNSFAHDYDKIFGELGVGFTKEILTFEAHVMHKTESKNSIYLVRK